MIEQTEILVLLRLLTAHLVADFLLQPRSWIKKKRIGSIRAAEFYYHIASVGFLTYLLLGDWSHILIPLFITFAHFLIDWWKLTRPKQTRFFVIDQLGHLLVILLGWIYYCDLYTETQHFISGGLSSPSFWVVLISYIIVIWPFGYMIAMMTSRWQRELSRGDSEQLTGLKNAGMWIGRTERFIILTFILLNQYSAIGFLIAAKSIFRFTGKLEGNQERKEAEYILIGTLLSFALSIVVGIGAWYMLRLFG